LNPCINTGKRYYVIDAECSHIDTRIKACKLEGIELKDSRDFIEGYLSDTKDYRTNDGQVFVGYFRDRFQAFTEARECGQIKYSPKRSTFTSMAEAEGIDLGLDSTKVDISIKQRAQGLAIAKSISTYEVMHTETKRKSGSVSEVIEYYR